MKFLRVLRVLRVYGYILGVRGIALVYSEYSLLLFFESIYPYLDYFITIIIT